MNCHRRKALGAPTVGVVDRIALPLEQQDGGAEDAAVREHVARPRFDGAKVLPIRVTPARKASRHRMSMSA